MADGGRGLPLRVEMRQDAAELGVRAQVRQRRMATGDEDAIEGAQLAIRERGERAGAREAVVPLHARDELLFARALVEAAREREQALAVGIGLGRSALGGCEGHLVAGAEEGREGLGELHEEEAGFLGDGFFALFQWETVRVGHDDEDLFVRHVLLFKKD